MKHEKRGRDCNEIHGELCIDDTCWCKEFQRKNAMTGRDDKRAKWREKEPEDGLSDEWWEGPGPHMDVRDDMINSPPHYILDCGVEVIDIIRNVLTHEEYIGYLRGTILAYHLRANKKGGNEDIRKANYYSNELNYELNKDDSS